MTRKPYLVIMTRASIDAYGHNRLFANELRPEIQAIGLDCRIIDYRQQAGAIVDALEDADCRGFICFNGFGTELLAPGPLTDGPRSAFQHFGKPLFDFMHDSPANEAMAHQVGSTFANRLLMSTDYHYAAIAGALGVGNVIHVPSITFPHAQASSHAPARDIPVLFAVGLSDPAHWKDRIDTVSAKGRIYQRLFEDTVGEALQDWRIDPVSLVETMFADLGMPWNWRNPDCRLLASLVQDFVKLTRRRTMLEALVGLPVTVLSDQTNPDDRFTTISAMQAVDLLGLMNRSDIVVCPTTHPSGFHERPLSAFTASAAVVSCPNGPLESNFLHGRDMMFFSDPEGLRRAVETLLQDASLRTRIAEAGHERAMQSFSPRRFVETLISAAETTFRLSLLA